jgi:hypothetical protein
MGDSKYNDALSEYAEKIMEQAAPVAALDRYLKELSVQMNHSPFVQVSVSEVVDKLLDIRNLMPDVIVDGDEMAREAAKKIVDNS